jgi:hypothetical protein
MLVGLSKLWQNEAKIVNYFNWRRRRKPRCIIAHPMTGEASGGTCSCLRACVHRGFDHARPGVPGLLRAAPWLGAGVGRPCLETDGIDLIEKQRGAKSHFSPNWAFYGPQLVGRSRWFPLSKGRRRIAPSLPAFHVQFETTKLSKRRFSGGLCFSKSPLRIAGQFEQPHPFFEVALIGGLVPLDLA